MYLIGRHFLCLHDCNLLRLNETHQDVDSQGRVLFVLQVKHPATHLVLVLHARVTLVIFEDDVFNLSCKHIGGVGKAFNLLFSS